MSKISILDDLQQDLEDLKSILKYESQGLTQKEAQLHAKAIIANLEAHLELFIE